MANPNRAMAHVPNRPWSLECSSRDPMVAREAEERLKAEGCWEVKRSSARMGPRGLKGWRVERVWKRERVKQ